MSNLKFEDLINNVQDAVVLEEETISPSEAEELVKLFNANVDVIHRVLQSYADTMEKNTWYYGALEDISKKKYQNVFYNPEYGIFNSNPKKCNCND